MSDVGSDEGVGAEGNAYCDDTVSNKDFRSVYECAESVEAAIGFDE